MDLCTLSFRTSKTMVVFYIVYEPASRIERETLLLLLSLDVTIDCSKGMRRLSTPNLNCRGVLQRLPVIFLGVVCLWIFLAISPLSICRPPQDGCFIYVCFVELQPSWSSCTVNLETVWKSCPFSRERAMSMALSRTSSAFGAHTNKL